MNPRRTITLIVAIVVAAVASVGLLNYVRSAADSAVDEAAAVPVWVVNQTIPKGTSIAEALENGMISQTETAANLRPATAVTDPGVELAGLVALTDLVADTPVLSSTFVSPGIVDGGISNRLKERGLVTVTFSVDATRGVANLIRPGDFVNILAERAWDARFFEREEPVEVSSEAQAELLLNLVQNDSSRAIISDVYPTDSRYVYQKAEVLAVGTEVVPDIGQTDTESDEPAVVGTAGLITLAVPPEAVQVILNVGRENLYLSLVPDDYEPRPLLPLDPTTQVLPGEDGSRLTPYEGIEGVVDPTMEITDLTFSEEGDRIGATPSAGDGSGTATDSGSDSTVDNPSSTSSGTDSDVVEYDRPLDDPPDEPADESTDELPETAE